MTVGVTVGVLVDVGVTVWVRVGVTVGVIVGVGVTVAVGATVGIGGATPAHPLTPPTAASSTPTRRPDATFATSPRTRRSSCAKA